MNNWVLAELLGDRVRYSWLVMSSRPVWGRAFGQPRGPVSGDSLCCFGEIGCLLKRVPHLQEYLEGIADIAGNVRARTESPSGAGEHNSADAAVGFQLDERRPQHVARGGGDRVESRRPVDCDHAHGVVMLDEHI